MTGVSGTGEPGTETRLETVRLLGPGVRERVDALARAAREADGVSPFGEHKWLRVVRGDDRSAVVLLWQGHELVAVAPCVAYHTPEPERPCRVSAEMVVDPFHRQRGYGTRLLEGIVALARVEGADELNLWSYGDLPAARQLVREIGAPTERLLLQMELVEDAPVSEVTAPEGIRLRGFDPAHDAEAWLVLHNRVFDAHPEQRQWDASDLRARLEQPWFRPRGLILADDQVGALIGFCWVKLPLDSSLPGELYIVGVDPALRGKGLGGLLTRAGLSYIRAEGRPGAMLYVEADNATAIALYEHFGFKARWRHVCYVQEVAALRDGAQHEAASQTSRWFESESLSASERTGRC